MSDDWKPKTGQKIEKLYAWICEEPDGGEGLIGVKMGDTWISLVGADLQRIESFRDHAQEVRDSTGLPIRLKVFGAGTIIDELK